MDIREDSMAIALDVTNTVTKCRVHLSTKVSEGTYASHIQCFNCHYYGHFAQDYRMQGSLKVWKRKEQTSYVDTESVPNVRQSNVQI